MEPSPSYERYCRERKASLDKDRYIERSRSMSEIVEEIFEIISTDDDMNENAKRETSITTSEPSCATWSLSSSAIVSSNPSISTTYDGDDDFDDVQKQIQSYTSHLFSPIYEVRAEQKNVFQENRKPLPKPGRTPKFRNLCYNLGTQHSFDPVEDFMDRRDFFVEENLSSPNDFARLNKSTCNIQDEHVLPNVNPLAAMTSAEVQVRNMAATTNMLSNATSGIDKVKNMLERASEQKQGIQESSLAQIIQFPIPNDEIFARKEWILNTSSTGDSGELSLEPLLNAYSEDFDEEEGFKRDKKSDDAQPILLNMIEGIENTIDSLTTPEDFVSFDAETQCIKFMRMNNIVRNADIKSTKNDVTNHRNRPRSGQGSEVRNSQSEKECTQNDICISMNQQSSGQITDCRITTNYSFLQQVTLDLPYLLLFHTLHASVCLFDTSIPREDMGCVSLVRYEKSNDGIMRPIKRSHKELNWVIDDYSQNRNATGCFLFDVESFCIRISDWENPMRSKYFFTCGSLDRQDVAEDKRSIDSLKYLINSEPIFKAIEGHHVEESDHLAVSRREDAYIRIGKGEEKKTREIDAFIRDNGLDTTIEFSEGSTDRSDLFPSLSQSSYPASFDSEQFLKDMALRMESELSYLDSNDENDNTAIANIFSELRVNSSDSDDGLDREIGALTLFELDLKNEIDKADKNSFLPPLTSPIQTLMSSNSSNCSMNTTFLYEYDASVSQMSDDMLLSLSKTVRKVHFNEQVEEFLYAANEACWTPDAKVSGRSTKAESFVEEIYSVFDEILDEINNACITLSSAMDRTKQLSKKGEIRRSSVQF